MADNVVKKLSKDELLTATNAFFERLNLGMSSASCNEIFESEFGKSIKEKFCYDDELFDVWKEKILNLLNN